MLKGGRWLEIGDKARDYGCSVHEVFEIAASLTMGRVAMRTIVPRLHWGHRSGSIPVSCWQRSRLLRVGCGIVGCGIGGSIASSCRQATSAPLRWRRQKRKKEPTRLKYCVTPCSRKRLTNTYTNIAIT